MSCLLILIMNVGYGGYILNGVFVLLENTYFVGTKAKKDISKGDDIY